MVLLAMLQAAAMERVGIPPHQRRDFHLYVDEFQSIATQSFITLLSEARKFGLSLVLANQFVSQIKDSRIMESVFGNVGTLICFRVGQQDAEIMEREMFPVFTRSDLINLPNWKACMSTLVNGQTLPPFTVQTVLDDVVFDENRAQEAQRLSRKKYGCERAAVEREIARSLTTGK
jgi:DNA helicase HerA-like ATPase